MKNINLSLLSFFFLSYSLQTYAYTTNRDPADATHVRVYNLPSYSDGMTKEVSEVTEDLTWGEDFADNPGVVRKDALCVVSPKKQYNPSHKKTKYPEECCAKRCAQAGLGTNSGKKPRYITAPLSSLFARGFNFFTPESLELPLFLKLSCGCYGPMPKNSTITPETDPQGY